MNYEDALIRLEELRDLIEAYFPLMHSSDERGRTLRLQIWEKYGEVEDVIDQVDGRQSINVPGRGQAEASTFANYIEAGFLSGRSIHSGQGHAQLIKIIGKVRRLAEDPVLPISQPSISALVTALGRFRECCQYIRDIPSSEKDVQDIVWIMLRSHFDRLDRESTLPKFGVKNYRPDFGIPDLSTLIEIKYIGEKTAVTAIQEELLADVPGYLSRQSRYSGIVVFVYDAAHKLRDPNKFIEDIRKVDGVLDLLVIPGIGPTIPANPRKK